MAEFDYGGLLGMLKPTEEDRQKAIQMGLLQAGLGILAGNTQRNLGPALGAGGLAGMQAYNQALQSGPQQRMAQLPTMLKMAELQQDAARRAALGRVFPNTGGMVQTGGQPRFDRTAMSEYLSLGGDPAKLKALRELDEGDKPQLVTVQTPQGPVQRWVRPGEGTGVDVGPQYRSELDPAAREAKIQDRIRTEQLLDPLMRGRAAAGRSLNVNQNFPARQDFKDEQALRKEYMDESASFKKLTEGYQKVKGALASDPTKSAPATLAGATQFMKMLDPESVVRESELQMALQSTGLLDRAMNLHNQVMAGKVLTPKQVEEIGKIADTVYNAAATGQGRRFETYRKMAGDYGFSGDRAVPELRLPQQPKAGTMEQMPPAAQHRGKIIEDDSGKRFRSDGMIWKPL